MLCILWGVIKFKKWTEEWTLKVNYNPSTRQHAPTVWWKGVVNHLHVCRVWSIVSVQECVCVYSVGRSVSVLSELQKCVQFVLCHHGSWIQANNTVLHCRPQPPVKHSHYWVNLTGSVIGSLSSPFLHLVWLWKHFLVDIHHIALIYPVSANE